MITAGYKSMHAPAAVAMPEPITTEITPKTVRSSRRRRYVTTRNKNAQTTQATPSLIAQASNFSLELFTWILIVAARIACATESDGYLGVKWAPQLALGYN